MTIKRKLLLVLTILFVFIVSLVSVNLYTFTSLEGDAPSINLSGNLRFRAYKMVVLSDEYLMADSHKRAELKKEIIAEVAVYDKILLGLSQGDPELKLRSIKDEEVLTQYQVVKGLWEKDKEMISTLLSTEDAGKMHQLVDKIHGFAGDYVGQVNKLVNLLDSSSQTTIRHAKMIEGIIFILGFIVTILAISIVNVQIIKPIRDLAKSFENIATGDGDLTIRLDDVRHDEIGQVSKSFNDFIEKIQYIIGVSQETSKQVSDLADTLSQASYASSQAVEQVATVVQDVAEGANQQNLSMNNLAIKTEDIAGNIKEMSQYAQNAATLSETSLKEATVGGQTAKMVSKQTEDLEHTVEHMNHSIIDLTEQSKEISDIIDLIKAIAGQTNLLALNAAIEAARAGESGRGFSVVAEEVRKLAEQSNQAADNITNKVVMIQQQVSVTGQANRVLGTELASIIQSVSALSTALSVIVERSIESKEAVEHIAGLNIEVSQDFVDVATTAQQVAKVADQIAEASETSAAVIEEQNASIEEFTMTSTKLSQLATQLDSLVAKFEV